jgi:hypothetical protein
MVKDDYKKTLSELRFKQVSEVFKKDHKNWDKHLEELGYTWIDDEEDDQEEIEEQIAKPENLNQEALVAFFNSDLPLSNKLLDLFDTEKDSEMPNYPLLRRYFKQGNKNLKQLILLGLEKYPSHIGLLNDLSYFHRNHGMLSEVIQRYFIACDFEENLSNFKELVEDFYFHTVDDGYDALYELNQRYGASLEKGVIVKRITDEVKSEPDTILF